MKRDERAVIPLDRGAVKSSNSLKKNLSHSTGVLLPPLAHHGRRRCHFSGRKTTCVAPAGSSVSTLSSSYLSSDSETETCSMSTSPSLATKRSRSRHSSRSTRRDRSHWDIVTTSSAVSPTTNVAIAPLQYSDDERAGSNNNNKAKEDVASEDSDDSLEFLDRILMESSERWKHETARTVSTTATARGDCGHLVSGMEHRSEM